ncbi:MAG TPA: diacylglycerol kinase family protein [Longimicrobiales bacterium]|nr:diacylglycerol kinase family protein [Longimicrobiales bacterium]
MVPGRDADLRGAGADLTSRRRHFVIFNPAAGRGRARDGIETYRKLLEAALAEVAFATTSRAGEESELAERAVAEGYDAVVAVGGDGTWSHVADRLVRCGRGEVVLGVLPNGTGNDFGRNLGYDPSDPAEAVRVLAEGHVRRVDVGRVETPSAPDRDPERVEQRHFLNLVGFGFDIAVIDAAARARFLCGELLYKVTALQQLFRFPGFEVAVESPDGRRHEGRHLMLTVSNGRFFGGGFPIAPGASVSDGLLHACAIGDASPLGRLRLFNMAERGRHVRSPRVTSLEGEGFRLSFPAPPRFEVDGDVRRAAGATVEVSILPAALGVIAPPA